MPAVLPVVLGLPPRTLSCVSDPCSRAVVCLLVYNVLFTLELFEFMKLRRLVSSLLVFNLHF